MSGLKQRLCARYRREGFFPTWLGMLTNPFYFARKGLARHIRDLGPSISGRTLDVGCGSMPYEALYRASEYVGLEYDSPQSRTTGKADVYYDGGAFPFEDASFDSVVANQVFEHVFNPAEFLAEVQRVLKPGGMLLMTMPFAWDEHEQPHDFARYSSFGIRALLEGHGFEVVEQRKSTDDIRAVFQLLNAYIFKKSKAHGWARAAAMLFLMAPLNILGQLLGALLPRNEDLYLDNIVLARRKDA